MNKQLTLCVHHWHIINRHGVCKLCGAEKDFKYFDDVIDEREAASRRRGRANSPLGNSTIKKNYGSRIKVCAR